MDSQFSASQYSGDLSLQCLPSFCLTVQWGSQVDSRLLCFTVQWASGQCVTNLLPVEWVCYVDGHFTVSYDSGASSSSQCLSSSWSHSTVGLALIL